MPWNAPGCHMFLFVFVWFCTFLHMIVFLVQICIYIYDLYIVIMFFLTPDIKQTLFVHDHAAHNHSGNNPAGEEEGYGDEF